ncbi:MAG: GGDEF domain-containing protein [Paenibacillus sp.]|nr:GGDEF domain-containing protein [Paenibacillus sp.]
MKLTQLNLDTRTLSRDIIRTLWWSIALYVAATSLNLFFTSYDLTTFVRVVLIIPTLKMIIIMICLEVVSRKQMRFTEYILIFGVNLIISTIIVALYGLPILFYLLILPILISLYYFNHRLIVFALVQGLITTLLINILSTNIRGSLSSSNSIVLYTLLIVTTMIAHSLRKRTFALVQELVKITEEKQDLQTKNVLMEKLNRVDSATGLYNHRSFHEHLKSILSLPEASNLNIHLALLDIDDFKKVNDTFGHAAGDAIIKFVATQLEDNLDPNDFASRYGGEEFAILSVEKSPERFYNQMEVIRRSIAEKQHEILEDRHVTISIGLQQLLPEMTKEELFYRADSALYAAKRSGKNQTCIL